MDDTQSLEQSIREVLPFELHDRIPQLVSVLQKFIQEAKGYTTKQGTVISSPDLESLITSLAGKELRTEKNIVSFGNGNQMGDITIRDIAGGDITTNNTIHLQLDNYTIQHRTYTPRKSASYPRRGSVVISQGRSIPPKKARNPTRSNSSLSNTPKKTGTRSAVAIARNSFVGLKVSSFTTVGLFFGWYMVMSIINIQHPYSASDDFFREKFIGAIIAGVIGLITGMSFLSKRRRASGIAWWGHIGGILFTGIMVSLMTSGMTAQTFWTTGVVVWFFFWLAVLGGYKEFR